jgi:hypothetical protein
MMTKTTFLSKSRNNPAYLAASVKVGEFTRRDRYKRRMCRCSYKAVQQTGRLRLRGVCQFQENC